MTSSLFYHFFKIINDIAHDSAWKFEGGPPMLLYLPTFRPLLFGSVACGCFICSYQVERLGGVCDGVEGGPIALHPVASFAAMSADSLPGTPEWAGIRWITS